MAEYVAIGVAAVYETMAHVATVCRSGTLIFHLSCLRLHSASKEKEVWSYAAIKWSVSLKIETVNAVVNPEIYVLLGPLS